jgi:hypothetical protein
MIRDEGSKIERQFVSSSLDVNVAIDGFCLL